MYFSILKNDFRKNKISHLSVMAFMSLATALLVTSVVLVSQVWSSIRDLYNVAQPPHFLQMHKGEFEQEKIDRLNASFPGIEDWQTVTMIDIYGDEIVVQGKEGNISLKECSLDIGFVKQNDQKDLLLDEDRKKIELSEGEIAVPVILKDTYDFKTGDRIIVSDNGMTKEFVIKDFAYDAQMNSTMCSSTRFLVNDTDFEEMKGKMGELEYLIEAYFSDTGLAADYQAVYEDEAAGMPKNGQAVTYSMIFLLSALTDLILAFLIFFVSLILLILAFICMKYTLLASLSEDLREIGTMKAIGIPHKAIRNLYLGKMEILLGAGMILGFLTSVPVSAVFLSHMRETFGKQQISIVTIILSALIGLAAFCIASLFCMRVIGKTKKLNIVHTIVNGEGLKERKYGLIFGVLFLVSCLITLPVKIIDTMESESFITYMGSGICDILLEIPQGEQLDQRNERLLEFIEGQQTGFEVTRRVRLETVDAEGKKRSLHVDTGESAGAGLQYLEGGYPAQQDDIAISRSEADLLGKEIGDGLVATYDGFEIVFTICGIYQDVTSGGLTAKAIREFPDIPAENYEYMIHLGENVDAEHTISEWKMELGNGYSIRSMKTFISQTLGGVISQIKGIRTLTVIIGIVLTAMITFLFMRLRMVREAMQIAIMKAIGLTSGQIRQREIRMLLLVAFVGSFAGNVAALLLGDDVASLIFRILGVGIEKISFQAELSVSTLCLPYLPLVAVVVIGMIVLRSVNDIRITEHLNEE